MCVDLMFIVRTVKLSLWTFQAEDKDQENALEIDGA